MKMNRIEKLAMNNPVRVLFQRWVESRLLLQLGGRLDGMRVLEVGCGRGAGTEIILRDFGAREVHAFDLDPDMIRRARRRLSRHLGDRVTLFVGDATALDRPDGYFDAVVNFAALHHIPDWQAAVAEISRLLRPRGAFLFEEVTTHALNRWSYRTFFDHPTENRFSAQEFLAELERKQIHVGDRFVTKFYGDFVFGAGTRANSIATTSNITAR